jgi:ligand-binding sensor domain-containing protein
MWRPGLVLSCVLAAGAVAIASPDRIVDRWSVQDGLPNNALSSILQSRDGYLWIATWAGIVRFDGVRFTPIAENLPNSHARVLFEDTRGAIWIGVAGSGLARWEEGRVETYTPAAGLAGQDVRAVAEDRGGRIWAGTEAGVSVIENGRVRTLRAATALRRPSP